MVRVSGPPVETLRAQSEAVLVATEDLSAASLAIIVEAVRRAGARMVSWRRGEAVDPSRFPSVIVGALPAGARRVPDSVTHLMTQIAPRSPLLLLCDERLMRAAPTVRRGRVTLLAPPHSASTVASRLRVLLASSEADAESGVPSFDRQSAGDAHGPATREYRRRGYWVGAFGGAGSMRPGIPVLHQRDATGLTAFLAETPVSGRDINQALDVLDRGEGDEKREPDLAAILGAERGLLRLGVGPEAGVDEWTAYWPRGDWSMMIFSHHRAPQVWDLSRSLARSGARLLRMRAAVGDLVIAWTAAADATTEAARLSTMAEGGPAVLDLFSSPRPNHRMPSGVVVEVL